MLRASSQMMVHILSDKYCMFAKSTRSNYHVTAKKGGHSKQNEGSSCRSVIFIMSEGVVHFLSNGNLQLKILFFIIFFLAEATTTCVRFSALPLKVMVSSALLPSSYLSK